MSAIKRFCSATTAAVIGLSSLLTLGFTGVAHAATVTDTWTGASGDGKFSTAGNWSGNAVPATGDALVFNISTLSADKTVTNDMSNLSVASLSITGTNSNSYGYTIAGNNITVGGLSDDTGGYNPITADVTLSSDVTVNTNLELGTYSTPETLHLNGHNLSLTTQNGSNAMDLGSVEGSGNVSTTGTNPTEVSIRDASPNWTGSLNISNGSTVDIAPGLAATTNIAVASGATLGLCGFNGASIASPLSIGGNGYTDPSSNTPYGALQLIHSCGMGGAPSGLDTYASANWTGPITLTADTGVAGVGELTISGALSGNYSISELAGNPGKVTNNSSNNTSKTPSGTQTAQVLTTNYKDNQPQQPIVIEANNIGIVDGTYGDTDVSGTIMGTGKVNSLSVDNGGIVAPGHSPGTLTVVSTLTLAGGATYQAELKDSAAGDYDQIVVGAPTDTDNNNPDVTLGDWNGTKFTASPTLAVSLYNGYKINKGDQFTIINNLSKTDVKGTFANLPEGATFKVNNYVYSISYKGGDGNDVVLTAQSVPATPNTGFALTSAHPAETLTLTVVAAGVILGIAQKLKPAHAKATRSSRSARRRR